MITEFLSMLVFFISVTLFFGAIFIFYFGDGRKEKAAGLCLVLVSAFIFIVFLGSVEIIDFPLLWFCPMCVLNAMLGVFGGLVGFGMGLTVWSFVIMVLSRKKVKEAKKVFNTPLNEKNT